MLYVLHGNDTIKARDRLHILINSLLKKKPDASFLQLDDETFDGGQLDELIEGQGLFEKKYIVVFDNCLRNKDTHEVLCKRLEDISSSPNIFVFLEEKIDKKILTQLEGYSEKIQEYKDETVKEKKEQFNIFSLTDAFGGRDKKKLWILYNQAKMNNITNEEIHGILFWQVKSMLLAKNSNSARESGLKPFVYEKAQRFCRNYSENEVQALSSSLVSLYHNARRGVHDFATSLELFIIKL